MQRPHGVLGNRSFPHEWQQRHQTPTEPNLVTTNEQASFPPQTLTLPFAKKKKHTKNASHHNPTTFPQATSWKPHHHTCCRAVLLFTIHLTHRSPPHAAQQRSGTRPRTVVSMLPWPGDGCGPHPATSNAAGVVQSCTNKSAAGLICSKAVDLQQHHCCGGRYGRGVERWYAAVARCPADVIHSTQQHQRSHRTGGMGSHPRREWTAEARAHGPCFQPQQLRHVPRCLAQDTWPIELRRATLTDINLVPFILETTGALDHTPENLLTSS